MNTQTPEQDMYGYIPGLPLYPSDAVCRALTSSMEQPAEPTRRSMFVRAPWGWWSGGTLIMSLALLCLIAVWYSNGVIDWMLYWIFAVGALLLQLIMLGAVCYVRRHRLLAPGGVFAPGQISVRTLWRGALAGDDSIAPPITIPSPSQAEPQPSAVAASFRVAPPESKLLRGQQTMSGISLALGIIVAAMWAALVFIMPQLFSIPEFLPWQMFALAALPPLVNGQRFIAITRKVRAIDVEARADGLHWGKHTLPWSEVRGWYIFAMNPMSLSNPRPNIIYALVGERASLVWLTYPPFTRMGEPGQLLAQHVQSRVTVPLRDLVPGAVHISAEVSGESLLRRPIVLAVNDWSLGETRLPRPPTAIAFFALAVLTLLGGILTPATQQWYFGGQLTRLETATSHIGDPLTANTLQWAPTSADAASDFAFTSQGYVFQASDCCNITSLMAQPMGNGLVEVTVRQRVTFDLSDVGILFRANSASNTALAFTITPNGEWHLDRFTIRADGTLADYRSLRYEGVYFGIGAIHQGLDATNRLAVLMQGSSYTFFVNGQYVGGYRADDMPQSGHMGVFVGGANGPVTFSDLLIVPE